jgi:cytochrome c biogenesis protein CcmG/thiol:disulfide interchange protein DsbE
MNWRRGLLAALVAAPIIALFAWGFTRDPTDIVSPLPGHPAPTFALSVFAPGEAPLALPLGDTVRLAALRGKVVVVNFWASWCLACRSEHAILSEFARRYAGQPVQFIGVLYNDETPAGLEWIKDMGGQSYPSINDPDARTAIDYGVWGVPETFFVDGSGVVAYKQKGPIPLSVLTHMIDSLIAALPVASAQKSGS